MLRGPDNLARDAGKVTATSATTRASSRAGIQPSQARYRPVYFSEAGRYVRTLILDRDELRAGDEFVGPIVIEERLSSTVAGPRCQVRVLDDLSLLIDIK